ncbi:MAG: hypothetical protein ACK5C7_10085, partial [Brevundimonas sp.]
MGQNIGLTRLHPGPARRVRDAAREVDRLGEGTVRLDPESRPQRQGGVRDVAVIVEPDAVLVCALDRAQDVKGVAQRAGAGAGDARLPPLADAATAFAVWMRTAALPLWSTLGVEADGAFAE